MNVMRWRVTERFFDLGGYRNICDQRNIGPCVNLSEMYTNDSIFNKYLHFFVYVYMFHGWKARKKQNKAYLNYCFSATVFLQIHIVCYTTRFSQVSQENVQISKKCFFT